MVIRDVVFDETAQVSLVEDEYVIQKIPATASDPAFRHTILPRACRADAFGFHAAGGHEIRYLPAELAITIQNGIAVRTRSRKCLPQLLLYPGAGRQFGDIEMDDLAPTVFDDEETIHDSEGEGRHGEEVHGRDHIAVIAKESCPERAGLVTRSQAPEIARDGTFGEVEAKLEKLPVHSWTAPSRILLDHLPNYGPNLGIDLWPAWGRRRNWIKAMSAYNLE
jgi:hypothetical protein